MLFVVSINSSMGEFKMEVMLFWVHVSREWRRWRNLLCSSLLSFLY